MNKRLLSPWWSLRPVTQIKGVLEEADDVAMEPLPMVDAKTLAVAMKYCTRLVTPDFDEDVARTEWGAEIGLLPRPDLEALIPAAKCMCEGAEGEARTNDHRGD